MHDEPVTGLGPQLAAELLERVVLVGLLGVDLGVLDLGGVVGLDGLLGVDGVVSDLDGLLGALVGGVE